MPLRTATWNRPSPAAHLNLAMFKSPTMCLVRLEKTDPIIAMLVSLSEYFFHPMLTSTTGRLDRSLSTHVEIANRHWRSLNPQRLRRLGNGPRCYLATLHRNRRDLVWIDRRTFQASSPSRVRTRRCWFDDRWAHRSRDHGWWIHSL